MVLSRFSVCMAAVALMAMGASMASGQNYPNRPIRMVAGAPGGSSDFAARTVAQGISGPLGQNVIVENRSFGVMAIEIVAKAPPDGYTLLYYGSALWIGPLFQKMSYDPVRDLAPVSMALSSPNILLVHPAVPAKSVKELIALAKAKPGVLNYGSGETGSSGHLSAEVFKYMTGVNIVRVPFKGQGPALIALLGGEVQMLIASAGGMAGYINTGKLRALGVTGTQRIAAFPDVPTVAESGVPGYEAVQRSGVWGPAKMPVTIINQLQQVIAQAVRKPDVKERFANDGVDPVGSTAQEFDATIKAEMAKMGKVIKEANLRIQ